MNGTPELCEYVNGSVKRADPLEIRKVVISNNGHITKDRESSVKDRKHFYCRLKIRTKNLEITLSPHEVVGIKRKEGTMDGDLNRIIGQDERNLLNSIKEVYKSKYLYVLPKLFMINFMDGGFKYKLWESGEFEGYM